MDHIQEIQQVIREYLVKDEVVLISHDGSDDQFEYFYIRTNYGSNEAWKIEYGTLDIFVSFRGSEGVWVKEYNLFELLKVLEKNEAYIRELTMHFGRNGMDMH